MGLKPPINVGHMDPPKAGYNGWRCQDVAARSGADVSRVGSPPGHASEIELGGALRVVRGKPK